MGPVDLLRNKRGALVSDDEAILLLTLGASTMRAHELREGCKMPERSFWRCLKACQRHGWLISEKTRPRGKDAGRGFKTIVRLNLKGATVLGRLLGEPAEPGAAEPRAEGEVHGARETAANADAAAGSTRPALF